MVGFYALAMSSLGHEGAPSRLRRGMPDRSRSFFSLAWPSTAQSHFDFHDLDTGRLWRRLGDIERALGC